MILGMLACNLMSFFSVLKVIGELRCNRITEIMIKILFWNVGFLPCGGEVWNQENK